ncbi:MAG: transposase, partial [Rhodopirellula bahusiensis]
MSESFHLDAPPGFRGLHPDLPVRIYHRHLPHWRQAGATYAITFRLADSIPQAQLRSLQRWREMWERSHQEPRTESDWDLLAREITHRTEAWLDQGYGQCVFQHVGLANEMAKSMQHFQDQRYLTSCYCVMQNHVHLVMKPLGNHALEDLLRDIKGFVSRKVNRELGLEGPLWEQESHDRIIRDEEHLYRIVQYIGNNPMKAGYAEDQWVRWVHP